jgi:hypothetical protein
VKRAKGEINQERSANFSNETKEHFAEAMRQRNTLQVTYSEAG